MRPEDNDEITQEGWGDENPVGACIDRFTVLRLLGRGGSGVVYLANDPLAAEPIALKVIGARGPARRERVAREITVLALLDDPGVVHLLGHGSAPEGIWIAMEHVEGRPFPGGPWEVIAATAASLAETLVRVHARGLVHRDLKPANVIVQDDGRPVVLDFGLVAGEALDDDLTHDGRAVGTPRYQAPEQLSGQRVDERADIYAFGVMLYEALAGRPPHESADARGLQRARLFEAPTPVEHLVHGLPPAVASLLRRMLSAAPEDRPYAEEVARVLSGRTANRTTRPARLDGTGTVDALEKRLRRGETLDVYGPRRSGRTRLVDELEERIPGAVRAVPSPRPYHSLLPVIGALTDESLPVVEAEVRARLARLPGPLLVDDFELQDAWTQALLATTEPPGGLLRVRDAPGAVRLSPLSHETLARLFAGPERLFHLPSDAATLVLRHTDGWPGRVADLLNRWTREARVRAEENGDLVIERDALDGLLETPPAPPPAERGWRGLDAEEEDLLVAAALTWPYAEDRMLACVLGRPRWEIETRLAAMARKGALTVKDGHVTPRAEPTTRWTPQRLRSAHATAAGLVPLDSPQRLAHRSAAGDAGALADEMYAAALRKRDEGRATRAIRLLWRLRALDPTRPGVSELLVRLLLEERTAEARDQAAFAAGAGREDLRTLVAAARLARLGRADEVDAVLAALPQPEDPELAMIAFGARVEAARLRPTVEQEALLERLRIEPHVQGDAGRRARWQNWLGILRYRQRRFAEAGLIHEAAIPARTTLIERLTSMLNAARAWMEADALDRAERLAEEARSVADASRLPGVEAQGAWLLRGVANRRGSRDPDIELPALIQRLGEPVLSAQAWLTEAFVAWRGRRSEALIAARGAERSFLQAHIEIGALHARSIAWACAPSDTPRALIDGLLGCGEPVIALDGLAILAAGGARLPLTEDAIRAIEHAQGTLASPYPRGAYSTGDALRLVRQSQETP